MTSDNFDQLINRHHTCSVKWDKYANDIIPLWVADMDFESPACVIDALKKRMNHGIFGYSHEPAHLKEILSKYLLNQYAWEVDPEWIEFVPSVVSSLYSIANRCTSANAHILTSQPVYHHLRNAAENSGREFDEVKLTRSGNRILINLEQLQEKVKPHTELMFFCNPHNPGGTVYSRNELADIAAVCQQEEITICSDEIHAGMVYPDKTHTPIASISADAAERTITLMSLNKTFNFPGAGLAWIICKNQKLRQNALKDMGTLIPDIGVFGYISTQAAIEHGETWRQQLISYLDNNRQLLKNEISKIPELSLCDIEASYLGWISCEKLNQEDPSKLFLKHGLALQPGAMFQQKDHVRINFATPESVFTEALNRIKCAVQSK